MMKLFVPSMFVVAVIALGQEPNQVPKPARVCVAQIRNQTATRFEMARLRQAFLEDLSATKLAKDNAIVLLPIEVDNSDDAGAELQKQSCVYAIYTRILRKPKEEAPRTLENGTTFEMTRHLEPPEEIYGLQSTVESASSGMPILIDRQFDTQKSRDEKGVLKLLQLESGRIESALSRKLAK